MGKGSKRQIKSARSSVKRDIKNNAFRQDDLDDEIDAFHKQRDVIPLDVNDEGDSEDEDLDEPVFDFEGGVDDDSDDVKSDNDDDDTDEDDNDVQPKGFAAKITRQAKYLQLKFGGGEDEMDDQEDEEEEEKKAIWGRKKNLYYDADNIDYELQSSDEELPMEEEAEVLKIQQEKAKFLSMEDFGIEEADHNESDSDKWDKTIQEALDGKKLMSKLDVDGAFEDSPFENYEKIKKDLTALSKEEQMDVVYSSAPELVGLLSELNEAIDQLQKVKPVLFKVREKEDTADGVIHYLEVKQILLLTYCQAISFYLLLKSEGHPVRDHPVIARLVEIKNLVEKVKQIDANLPSQIEDIVNHNSLNDSSNGVVGERAPLEPESCTAGQSAKPDEAALVNETTELAKVNSSKDHHNGSVDQKQQDSQVGLQSLEMLKLRANLEEKLKQKGIYNFTGSKSEKKQNHTLKPVNRSLETVNNFDDEVQQSAIGHHMNNGGASLLKTSKLSQLVAAKVKKFKVTSGDDDLPKRDDIGERRRKHELQVLASAGAYPKDDDDLADEDGNLEGNPMDIDASKDDEAIGSEDEFYKEVKKQRAEKLKAKADLYSRTLPNPSSVEEPESDGRRQITYQIEKNRGLTRPRKKLTKIPRKKYKIKHQKAVMRRKGQVRDIRKPTGPYGGESTGINISVSRSIRFKS